MMREVLYQNLMICKEDRRKTPAIMTAELAPIVYYRSPYDGPRYHPEDVVSEALYARR